MIPSTLTARPRGECGAGASTGLSEMPPGKAGCLRAMPALPADIALLPDTVMILHVFNATPVGFFATGSFDRCLI